MFTLQKLSKEVWLVHYETITNRWTKTFKSEKEAKDYIKLQK